MDVVLEKKSKKGKVSFVIFLCFVGFLGLFYIIPQVFIYTESHYEIGTVKSATIVQRINFEGKVDFKTKKAVQAKVPGLIEELLVTAGDTVKKGDKLLTLDTSLPLSKLTALEREAFQLQSEKEQLQIELQQEVLNFQNNMRIKEAALATCQEQLERYNKLLEKGAIAPAEVENLKTQMNNLTEEIQFLIANHSLSLQGYSVKEKYLNEMIKNINAEIEKWKAKINHHTLEAESDGVVLECLVKEGQIITENQVCFILQKLDDYSLKIKIPPREVNLLQTGDLLDVKFEGDSTLYPARLEHLSSIIKEEQGYGSYVEGFLSFTKDQPPAMIGNMKFTAMAPLVTKENVLALERGPYLTDVNQKYVFRVSKDRKYAEKVPVTFGLYDETQIEIKEGLALGDEILISSYNRFKERTHIKLR